MSQPKYLVALPISPFDIGPYTGKSSFHCTLMHWFTLPSGLTEGGLKEVINKFGLAFCREKIELVSGEKALFGPNSDVLVNVLVPNKSLEREHCRLLGILRARNCVLPRADWIGSYYIPHVTVSNGVAFATGSRHIVSSLALIKSEKEDKAVIYQLTW